METGRSREYDEAAQLVEALWTLAQRDGRHERARSLLVELRARFDRRPAFQRRLDELAIPTE